MSLKTEAMIVQILLLVLWPCGKLIASTQVLQ